MDDRELLLAELGRECVKPVPPPPPVTNEQRRIAESHERLREFMARWDIK